MKNKIALAILAAVALLTLRVAAQIITGSTGITNGTLSAPIQFNFTPVTASESINLYQHAAQIGNVTTNETITLSYGRQASGASGTNLAPFAILTTNFNAGWTFTNFGYTTNNFSVILVFPPQTVNPVDQLWGTFSNSLGSNTVTFQ